MTGNNKAASKKRVAFLITGRQETMVHELQNKLGYSTSTQVFTEALSQLHRKVCPEYLGYGRSLMTPEEKAREKVLEKQERKRLEIEEKTAIVEEVLGGTVENSDGRLVARYWKYSGRKRYLQELPLSMIDAKLADVQYSPSREKVEEMQAKGKVDYDPADRGF